MRRLGLKGRICNSYNTASFHSGVLYDPAWYGTEALEMTALMLPLASGFNEDTYGSMRYAFLLDRQHAAVRTCMPGIRYAVTQGRRSLLRTASPPRSFKSAEASILKAGRDTVGHPSDSKKGMHAVSGAESSEASRATPSSPL